MICLIAASVIAVGVAPWSIGRRRGRLLPDTAPGCGRLLASPLVFGERPLQLLLVVAAAPARPLHGDVPRPISASVYSLRVEPLGVDQVVHQRLGERRVVRLVVPRRR
jgi:hypothetical protein